MAIQVAGVLAALQIADALIARLGQVNSLIKTAQTEKRDVTDAELDQLMAADDVARGKLVASIERGRAGQPPGASPR